MNKRLTELSLPAIVDVGSTSLGQIVVILPSILHSRGWLGVPTFFVTTDNIIYVY